ncbi:hypothetical protein ACFSUK_28905 [Sphingobium scionense]
MNWRRIFARRRPALSLDALVAATRAANAPWAAKRRAQLPNVRPVSAPSLKQEFARAADNSPGRDGPRPEESETRPELRRWRI